MFPRLRVGLECSADTSASSKQALRAGFTLVELLVAMALVILIMFLFVEVFDIAIGTMQTQQSIAQNDQKARSIISTLERDFAERTFRQAVTRGSGVVIRPNGSTVVVQESAPGIVPLGPGDMVTERQDGFIYISENDTFDDGDDVLHLTVFVNETLRAPIVEDPNEGLFYGTCPELPSSGNGAANPNQPDGDDGNFGNGTMVSRAAEIVYFLRGTTLYRRVLLLRDPRQNAVPPFSTQPQRGNNGTGGPYDTIFHVEYPPHNLANPRSFYDDWDSSGTRVWTIDDGNGMRDDEGTDGYRFHFHGLESLDNSLGTTNIPLAIPSSRFGFFLDGIPREFLFDNNSPPNPIAYIGRYTHEETSSANPLFEWPGYTAPPGANIMQRTDRTLTSDGVVAVNGTPLGGPRAGEDILATDVEAFDIEVWDTGFVEDINPANGMLDMGEDVNGNGALDEGAWVDLGHNFPIGHYRASKRANQDFGPFGNTGSGVNRVYDTWHPSLSASPPYRLLQVDPMNGITWPSGMAVTAGDVVFPDAAIGNASIGYIALNNGTTGTQRPEFPRQPGTILTDGTVAWRAFDNRIGLQKIRITIRFRDPKSLRPRQLTFVHSFIE